MEQNRNRVSTALFPSNQLQNSVFCVALYIKDRSVPDEVMIRMHKMLEPPDFTAHRWENTVTLAPHGALQHASLPQQTSGGKDDVNVDLGESGSTVLASPLYQMLQVELMPELAKQWAAPVPPIPVLTAQEKKAQVGKAAGLHCALRSLVC